MHTTHLIGATGNIGKRIVEKGGDLHNINVISRFELKLDQRPLYYNFDSKSIGGTAIKEGDIIIFAAAISEPSVVSAQFEKAFTVNVESTGDFIEKALEKGCKVLFLSSDTVYGNVEKGFNEDQPVNPRGAYAEMKAVIEKRFLGNPNFRVFRLSYNLHKDDRFTKYLRQCAESGVEAEIFDPLKRAVIHRDDTVDAILNLCEGSKTETNEEPGWKASEPVGPIINCGGPKVISRQELTEIIKRVALPNLKYKVTRPPAKFYGDRPEVINMICNGSHCKKCMPIEMYLGRLHTPIEEAVKIEFGLSGEVPKFGSQIYDRWPDGNIKNAGAVFVPPEDVE